MNRKKFLGLLGLAAAAPIVAKTIEDKPQPKVKELEPVEDTITFTFVDHDKAIQPEDYLKAFAKDKQGTMYSHNFDTGEPLSFEIDPFQADLLNPPTTDPLDNYFASKAKEIQTYRAERDFDYAVREFCEYFYIAEYPPHWGTKTPSFEEIVESVKQSIKDSTGEGFNTIEEKTKGLRDEVAAWKRIKTLPKEQAEKELGYPILGDWSK